MILYFSGTGNSKFVADCFSDFLQESVVSINNLFKEWQDICIKDRIIIFVFPVYCESMLNVLFKFIKKSHLYSQSVYFFVTYHNNVPFLEKCCKKLCTEKEFDFRGFSKIRMLQNHIMVTDTTNPNEIE